MDSNQLAVREKIQPDAAGRAENEESKKTLAPDFMVYDLAGNAVKLFDYIEKPSC